MITKTGAISRQVAEAGSASLDKEVAEKREKGKLEAGKTAVEFLSDTPETDKAKEEFERSLDMTGLESLNVTTIKISKWTRPFIYGEPSRKEPIWFKATTSRHGVIGVLALSDLTLPHVGSVEETVNTTAVSISAGSVAYFRENARVEYRDCRGRGMLFSFAADTKHH